MKKKIIYSSALTALLCASSAALAGGPEIIVEPDYFSGFYVGGTGALHHALFDSTTTVNLSEPVFLNFGGIIPPIQILQPGTLATNDTDGRSLDGYGGIQGGWGKVFNHQWYLGIQGFGEWGTNSDTSNNTTSVLPVQVGILGNLITINNVPVATNSTTVKVENDYGVAAKLGYLVTPRTMVYGKIGASWAEIKVSNTTTLQNDLSVNAAGFQLLDVNTFSTASNSDSDTKVGLLLGIGFEQFVYQDMVSINVEYDYVNYGSVDTGTSTLVGNTVITSPFVPGGLIAAFAAPSIVTTQASGDAKVGSLLGGINFYFGRNWF